MKPSAEYPLKAPMRFLTDESGASLLEYALLGFLLVVVCLLGFLVIGKYA